MTKMTRPRILSGIAFLLILSALTPAPALPAASREIYAAGRKCLQEEKWQQGLEILKPLASNYELLADYVLWDIATCYEKTGNPEEALNSLRKIVGQHKKSPLYRRAFLKILEIGKKGDAPDVLADFDLYLKEFPQDGKALWEKAVFLEKSNRKDDASALWKEIFFLGSPFALNAYEALKWSDYPPSPEDIKKAAASLLERGNHLKAISLLEGVNAPDEEGRYLLARAYFRQRLYRNAIKMLTGTASPEGKHLLALSLLRNNDKPSFYKLADELPAGSKDSFSLRFIAAELKRREGNYREATAILQSLLEIYPEKKEEINWSQAWLAIRQRHFPEADNILTELVSQKTRDRDKHLFWLGKVKSYQGQKGDAFFSQMKDRNSYYWFRSVKKSDAGTIAPKDEALLPKTPPQFPQEEIGHHFLRISELSSLRMKAEARTEARTIMGLVKDQHIPALAGLLIAIEDYPTLVKLGVRCNDLSLTYPLAFRETVVKCAQEQKTDPLLIMAIMREESRFQHDAVSVAGALGIMQLMPATARGMGQLKNNTELFDVGKNVGLGTRYLAKLLSQFKLMSHAIAAYNAGEHNVEKWLAAGYLDEEEFTEDIPFSETKNYVFKVTKSYGVMKSLYGKEGRNQ